MNSLGIEVGRARQGSPRCPFCREDLAELPACECSACAVGYHLECAQELESCATVGCAGDFLARCPSCDEELEVGAEGACEGCGRVYHPRCRTEAEGCECGASWPRRRPALRVRRREGLSLQGSAVTAFQVLTLLAVAGIEIWAMIEATTHRGGGGWVQQNPIFVMIAPLVIGAGLVSLPYLLGWKAPE